MQDKKIWPGPKAREILRRAKKVCATTTVESGFVPSTTKRAKGIYLYDADGNKFMDFFSGVGVANCGYGVREIEKAITDHMQRTGRIQFMHNDFYNPEAVELCEVLVKKIKEVVFDDYKVFLCNSGTEANEAGLKLAFAARPERHKILVFRGSFHGRTLGSLPSLWNYHCRKDYPQTYPVTWLTFPRNGLKEYVEKFEQELKDLENSAGDYNSLILELVQGQGGIYSADFEAISMLEDFCHRHNILIHLDEVQTGFGRTGAFLALEYYAFKPDIITLAKAIANGYPIGATIFRADLDWKEEGRHSNTFGGNALGAAAALATLKYMLKNELFKKASRCDAMLYNFLKQLAERYGGVIANARGIGLMQAVDFIDANGNPNMALRHRVIQEGYRLGLILIGAGESAIRIMPPLVISERELRRGLRLFETAIENALKSEKK